jgi:hypothetical protein
VPGVVLRGVRVRGVPDGGGQHRPPLRAHRLLRPLRALPTRLLGAAGGRRASPPVHPMCVQRNPALLDLMGIFFFVRLVKVTLGGIYFVPLVSRRD